MGEGQLVRKGHPHYEEIYPMLRSVHLAHTKEMKELLEVCIWHVWEEWELAGEQAGTYTNVQLWNEYFVAPWVRRDAHGCAVNARKYTWMHTGALWVREDAGWMHVNARAMHADASRCIATGQTCECNRDAHRVDANAVKCTWMHS